ncbi:DUF6014 family protein [Nostoc sp.]|uniref:DUF6014 family protein n=1 Tax=Nostoc sp. TaxID=1180 RepID=UPI002FFA52A4
MTAIFVNEQELVKQIVEYVEQDEIAIAVKKLRQQAANSRELLPLWLLNTADALEKNDWDILSEGFINKDFIGKNGYFLIIAPYKINRQSQPQVTLSAIYGKMHDSQEPSIEQLENLSREKFGKLGQPVPRNYSFTEIASCGNISGESGEAFIVPYRWCFRNSSSGPVLNNASEQRRRFLGSSRECIKKIFEYETANLLNTSANLRGFNAGGNGMNRS